MAAIAAASRNAEAGAADAGFSMLMKKADPKETKSTVMSVLKRKSDMSDVSEGHCREIQRSHVKAPPHQIRDLSMFPFVLCELKSVMNFESIPLQLTNRQSEFKQIYLVSSPLFVSL